MNYSIIFTEISFSPETSSLLNTIFTETQCGQQLNL